MFSSAYFFLYKAKVYVPIWISRQFILLYLTFIFWLGIVIRNFVEGTTFDLQHCLWTSFRSSPTLWLSSSQLVWRETLRCRRWPRSRAFPAVLKCIIYEQLKGCSSQILPSFPGRRLDGASNDRFSAMLAGTWSYPVLQPNQTLWTDSIGYYWWQSCPLSVSFILDHILERKLSFRKLKFLIVTSEFFQQK